MPINSYWRQYPRDYPNHLCCVCLLYVCGKYGYKHNQLTRLDRSRIVFESFNVVGWLEGSCLDRCSANVFNVRRIDFGGDQRKHGSGWSRRCIPKCLGHRSHRSTNVSSIATNYPTLWLHSLSFSVWTLTRPFAIHCGRKSLAACSIGYKRMPSARIWSNDIWRCRHCKLVVEHCGYLLAASSPWWCCARTTGYSFMPRTKIVIHWRRNWHALEINCYRFLWWIRWAVILDCLASSLLAYSVQHSALYRLVWIQCRPLCWKILWNHSSNDRWRISPSIALCDRWSYALASFVWRSSLSYREWAPCCSWLWAWRQ